MAKKLVLNNGMNNAEIIEQLEAHGIELGNEPIIIDIVESENNPDWTMLFMIASVTMKSSNSSLTAAQLRMKKWTSNEVILRSIESVPTEDAGDYELGQVLEGLAFQVQDSTEEWYEGQNPRITKAGELLVDEDGNSVYRRAVVIDAEELVEKGHAVISVKPEAAKEEEKPSTPASRKVVKKTLTA